MTKPLLHLGDISFVIERIGRRRRSQRMRANSEAECDASLMPTIPCANTNLPTIMMAEKVSDALAAEFLVRR
jgi:hypothetical protein